MNGITAWAPTAGAT